MNYALDIHKNNIKPHLDIEEDMAKQKEGTFTFVLRINNGNIVDYSVTDYVDIARYFVLKQVDIII